MKRITLLTAILAMLLSPTVSAATPQAEEGSIANFTLNVEVPPPEIGSIVGTYNHRMIYLRRGCCRCLWMRKRTDKMLRRNL